MGLKCCDSLLSQFHLEQKTKNCTHSPHVLDTDNSSNSIKIKKSDYLLSFIIVYPIVFNHGNSLKIILKLLYCLVKIIILQVCKQCTLVGSIRHTPALLQQKQLLINHTSRPISRNRTLGIIPQLDISTQFPIDHKQ